MFSVYFTTSVCCLLFMLSVKWRIWGPCLKNGTLKTDCGQQEPNPPFLCAWSSVPSSSTTPSMSTQNLMARWGIQHFVTIYLYLLSALTVCHYSLIWVNRTLRPLYIHTVTSRQTCSWIDCSHLDYLKKWWKVWWQIQCEFEIFIAWNIFILIKVIKWNLYVDRQGWQKRRCSRRSRCCLCEQQPPARRSTWAT